MPMPPDKNSHTAFGPAPLTVIGGFLGAGKTTLLNHILSNSDAVRFAVLVNDFGAINIDASLIEAHDGQTLTLSNGCICCSLSNGFIDTLLALMQRRESFDHIVVEASGVSEPQRIMDIAKLDPDLTADAIICVVDASNVHERLGDPAVNTVVQQQIRSANVLLLNKTDINPTLTDKALATVKQLNTTASILSCQHSAVAIPLLLGNAADASLQSNSISDASSNSISNTSSAIALPQFYTHSTSSIAALDRTLFEQAISELDANVLRAKGIVFFSDDPKQAYVWQRVGNYQTLSKKNTHTGPTLNGGLTSESHIVLIATMFLSEQAKGLLNASTKPNNC